MEEFNVKLIKSFIKMKNLTVKEFCKLSKITYHNYLQIIHQDFKLNAEAFLKVAKALHISPCCLFISDK